MKNLPLIRQEAEALVDLLEENPAYQVHDKTALEMAAEIRQAFGMVTKADGDAAVKRWEKDRAEGRFRAMQLPPHHHHPFSQP